MGFDRFYIGVGFRVAAMAATLMATLWMVSHTHWYVTIVVSVVAALAQIAMLTHFATQSSRELARFLDALSIDDTSLTFSASQDEGAFRDLRLAMTRVLERLRAGRAEREEQAQYLQALIAHVPVALLSVSQSGAVQLLNMAARRLFEGSCADVSEFARYGEGFATGMESLTPGTAAILPMERTSGNLQMKAAATGLVSAGARRRLISLQNIQTELSAQELAAWQTVIRVMAHEVMNSLTPVASLATTARGLVSDVLARLALDDPNRATLTDAGDALEIMAVRSAGLLRFVQNHRRLTRRLVVKIELVPLSRVFARLRRLLVSELESRNIELTLTVTPEGLELPVDPELLDQALLNLVRNAIEAMRETNAERARIGISAFREHDNHVVITVEDNGPGVSQELRQKVFVPFFTTKRQGSGLGLTLVRQIVAAHGGMVGIAETPGGGATFKLRF
jgi:nitrogen fixation/metabolism regulation signal transduction histidine kinase